MKKLCLGLFIVLFSAVYLWWALAACQAGRLELAKGLNLSIKNSMVAIRQAEGCLECKDAWIELSISVGVLNRSGFYYEGDTQCEYRDMVKEYQPQLERVFANPEFLVQVADAYEWCQES